MDNSQTYLLNAQFAILALLLPTGLILLAGGALKGRRPAKSAVAGLGALALAAISFWATGFAFHLGGIGLVFDQPGLEGLVWEWASPFNLEWGVMGLRGFFLLDEASTPLAMNLYLSYLPALAVAVILPALSLRERMPGWMAALGGLLIAALVYPIAANWFSGGGWLMHIGNTLGLSHGYVDLTGASTAAVIGGLAALLGILFFGRRLPPLPEGESPTLPPVHLPVLAVLGAILAIIGTSALVLANPLHTQTGLITPRAGVNLALAAAGGAFVPWLYTWFTTGTADSLVVARGAAAGVLSVAAAMAFIPPWAALALGAAVGLLVPLVTFLIQHILRIEDPTGAIPVGLLGGVVGVLAVGLFGDGLAGQGWNGIGPESYLAVAGQGVTGFFPAPGLAPDWPGQLNAQLVGLAAISGLTVALVGALFLILKVLLLLWRAVPAPAKDDQEPTAESSGPSPESAPQPQDEAVGETPADDDQVPSPPASSSPRLEDESPPKNGAVSETPADDDQEPTPKSSPPDPESAPHPQDEAVSETPAEDG